MKNHSTTKQPLSLQQIPSSRIPPPISRPLRPTYHAILTILDILIILSISLPFFFLHSISFPFLRSQESASTSLTIPIISTSIISALPGIISLEFFGLVPSTFAISGEVNSRNVRNSPNQHGRRHSYRSRSGFVGNGNIQGRTSPSPLLLPAPVPWWNIESRYLNLKSLLPQPGQLRAKVQGQPGADISLLLAASNDKHGDSSSVNVTTTSTEKSIMTKTKGMNNKARIITQRGKTKEKLTKGIGMIDMDQIMNDMGAWSFHKDGSTTLSGQNNYNEDNNGSSKSGISMNENKHPKILNVVDPNLSTVKIIPDEHHVSAYLNKGILKRFLFLNDKFGNPLSITITPCTSILLWNVKFWPVSENRTQAPIHLKTYRTQRTVTFTEPTARRGIYSIDIRALHWDSYVHLYGTSFYPEPMRNYFPDSNDFNKFSRKGSTFSDNLDKFYQHSFTQGETHTDTEAEDSITIPITTSKNTGSESDPDNPLNIPSSVLTLQMNSNANNNAGEETMKTSTSGNKPRIWVRRLSGNRLQVKWDTSPINPHLMNYCIVVNTRRDYSSLCSASGERFGVLPPDLMHVTYYGPNNENNVMVDNIDTKNNSDKTNYHGNSNNGEYGTKSFFADSPDYHQHGHRHGHGKRQHRQGGNRDNYGNRKARAAHEDIVLGCLNRKTNYILNNLNQGRLYYFNVFLRDLSTNVSYPYVRTTLKYQTPKSIGNGLRDAKPSRVKLSNGPGNTGKHSKPTTLKFNLNKPCNELTIYVMPCGGGSITYEAFHGNRSIYESSEVDSLDIIKIALPQRGKYFIKISQANKNSAGQHQARMAEVYVAKKNKRFPLPKLPTITKISEDESQRSCDSVSIQWWPSPDPRDNEYCIFLKEESRKRVFQFKKPNQCDVERSLKSDPYVTHSLCLQRTLTPEMMLLSQKIVGLQPGKTYIVQLILRRHNGKSLSYDLHHVKTLENCTEN